MNTISFQGAHKSAKQQPHKKSQQAGHQHLHKPASKPDHGDSFSKSDKAHKPTLK